MRSITILLAVICVSGCSTYQVPRGTSMNPEIRDLQTRVAVLEHRAGIRPQQPKVMSTNDLLRELERRGLAVPKTYPYPQKD